MSRSRRTNIEPRNELQIVYKNNILQPLKGFCTIVNSDCSFVEASRKLGLTPATLTKQVQSLEKALNMDLFDRTSSKCLKLTEIGQKFYDMGADVLAKMDNLVYTFKEKTAVESESVLKIGMTPFMLKKLIPLLALFRNMNPDIKFNIRSCNQGDGMVLVEKNKLDLFVTSIETRRELDASLEFIKLFDYIPYWILWKGHPLAKKKELNKNDLLKYPLVYDDINVTMMSLRVFYDEVKPENIVNVTNMDLDTRKDFVRYRFGIWVIFNIFCNEGDKEEFVFKKATNLFPSGEYGLVVNKFRKNNVTNLINFITEKKDEVFDEKLLD